MGFRLWIRFVLCAGCALALTGCPQSDSFPKRPITLICPWSAGGGSDQIARQMAAGLEREVGVPVNVVNATGGAGVTGHTRGMLARPDGYTLTLLTAELNMLHWRGLTSITYRDCDPLMLVNRDDAALFVKKDAPWGSLGELERAIREKPGQVKASGTAQGGIWHVSLAGWLEAVGLQPDDVIWISINGAAPSLQELMAGGVDLVCCSLPEAASLLGAGEIRCLGLMAAERAALYPDIPTFKEQGVDWCMGTWRGLALPNGVPEERRQFLVDAIGRVATGDAYLEFMRNAGFSPAAERPEEFARTLETFDERFGAILTSPAFQSVQTHRFGPMFFPYVLAGALALNVLVLAVSKRLRRRSDVERIDTKGALRIVMICGAVVAYILLAEWLGFLITPFVILSLLQWRLGVRWYVSIAVALLVVGGVYQMFGVWLGVPLPLGVWGL